jgi:nitroimidazol reductase NimA-like FMN-containing flavoprotein (pyridoxamine 5'-phosphate oxidase superfamily)
MASPEIAPLSEVQCWSYLRGQQLGRVSVLAGGRPHIFPVNYATADGTIVFRTAPGAKLNYGPGSVSCFEVDGYDAHSLEGWSVMAFGRLEEITHASDERSRSLRQLPVQQLAPGTRLRWIAMRVDEVTGRHFSGGWIEPGTFFG